MTAYDVQTQEVNKCFYVGNLSMFLMKDMEGNIKCVNYIRSHLNKMRETLILAYFLAKAEESQENSEKEISWAKVKHWHDENLYHDWRERKPKSLNKRLVLKTLEDVEDSKEIIFLISEKINLIVQVVGEKFKKAFPNKTPEEIFRLVMDVDSKLHI